MITSVNPEDAVKIVYSSHNFPQKILGMHSVDFMGKACVAARAFFPDAKELYTVDIDTKKEYAMVKVHEHGFFEYIFQDRKEKFKYKFKAVDYFNHSFELDDAYAYWNDSVTEFDRYLFNRSAHYKIYEKMGAHISEVKGVKGVNFAVWAPNAQRVSVVGKFNNWDGRRHGMNFNSQSGIWTLFIPGLVDYDIYKFEIKGKNGNIFLKTDPFSFYCEKRPATASVVYDINGYEWNDADYMKNRIKNEYHKQPVSIYELHLGSWQRDPSNPERFLTYKELAGKIIPYVKEAGFTHIELMPVMEHPLDASWGYQVSGYFAPTSRFGTPKEFMYFIDKCHQNGIGVIADWVPAHFPKDAHGLAEFDGTALYEHADPKKGEHPDWGTKIFNYGRNEVKNFLIANALFWLDKYHIDGLRVDAVASILYLDYSKKEGEWIANEYGGRENIEAIEFLKHLNSVAYEYYPGIMIIAEESTSWPGVSRPAYSGGLGFGFKWNMGWMHDILYYMSKEPVHRKYHHNNLTFGMLYAFSENFMLPFSHDEVVHGKRSLINRMPGDIWQKFANLRLLYSFLFFQPGKKLLFMGQEFAQFDEWDHSRSLDWHLFDYPLHKQALKCVKDLNKLYKTRAELYEKDCDASGFEWINCNDSENSVISFLRRSENSSLVIALNFTPVPRSDYILGVDESGYYREIFNSDSGIYGGSNTGNCGRVRTEDWGSFGRRRSLKITLPPLAAVAFELEK